MIADIRTDEGLRDALARIPDEGGWDGPVGRLLIDTLTQVAYRWCPRDTRVHDSHRRGHLVGVAWEMLKTNPEAVIDARSPWSLLDYSMRRRGAHAAMADELGTSERHASRFTRSEVLDRLPARPRPAARIDPQSPAAGLFDMASERDRRRDPVGDEAVESTRPPGSQTDGWDAALHALHDELVAAGAPAKETTDAINNVIDAVTSTTSRSRMHTAIYRSTDLDDLTHAQRRALAELIIGTRGGGADDSAWAALRRALADGQLPGVGWCARDRRRIADFVRGFRRSEQAVPLLAMAS